MLLRLSLSAAALLAGVGIACAQQNQLSDPAQQQNHDNMLQTKPGQNGKEEPSAHAPASADTGAFVNGKLAVPGAPQDSQTVPAKFSERNAKLDALPIMALPLGLSDEQKHRIAADVAKGNAPVDNTVANARLADILPATTKTAPLPDDVKADAPMARDLQYIRLKDKILLVRAPNMIVTGEVAIR